MNLIWIISNVNVKWVLNNKRKSSSVNKLNPGFKGSVLRINAVSFTKNFLRRFSNAEKSCKFKIRICEKIYQISF